MQDHHVVEGGEQRRVGNLAVRAARDLRDDDLRLGGDSDDLVGVTGGNPGHVRAVGYRGGNVRVILSIVVREGELLIHVDPALTLTQLRCQHSNVLGGHRRRACECTRESRVRDIDACVDDRDDLTLTLLGHLVGAHHELGAEVVRILV